MKEAPTLKQIQEELHTLANKKIAQSSQRFFKTGPGQYGEGDFFLGIRVPTLHALSKQALSLNLEDLQALLDSKWHEERLIALLILRRKYAKTPSQDFVDFYLKNTKKINNWDLVDTSAPYILGAHLLTAKNSERALLYTLVESENLWERRIAILSTFTFIREHDFIDTFKLSERLLKDKHDLMHKAVGWMLREVGKKDEKALKDFLDKHTKKMPRTALRYAIERFSKEDRSHYLNLK